MPINDSSDQLDLIGFLVLKYLIMKKFIANVIASLIKIIIFTTMFYFILTPFHYIGFDKIFSIVLILAMFLDSLSHIKSN